MDPFQALGAQLIADEREKRKKERKRKNSRKYRKKRKARELERVKALERLKTENEELKEKLVSLMKYKQENHQLVKQLKDKVIALEMELILLSSSNFQVKELFND